MMLEADAAKVTDALSASIESGMVPSAMKAWHTGGDMFGVVVPVDGLAARLLTFADVGGWGRFVPGGHTAVKIGGEFCINETREFVVEGGIPMPAGSVVFKLLDGGHWDPILIYGRSARATGRRRARQLDTTMPEYDARKPRTVEAWRTVSEKFAEGASGEVHLIGGTGIRPTSIWVTREFEALKNNPAITKIVQVDPASGYTRVIWPE